MLETPLASPVIGSTRANTSKTCHEDSGRENESVADAKSEVEDALGRKGVDGGGIACSIPWPVPPITFSCLRLLKFVQ